MELETSRADGENGFRCKKDSAYDFESALSLTGFGRFHWLLLCVCGLTYMAFCYQGIVSSYIGPAAQCDLQMTSQELGFLNAIFIIGGMSSAIPWGILADQYGRRKILIISLFADGILTATSSLSQSFALLMVFRFFNGFMMVAPGSVILTYLVESIGIKYRSRCLVAMGAFCTLAFVALPLISIVILPIQWMYHTENFTYNSWRIFTLVSSVPSFVSAICLLFCLYESPKYLYSQGNVSKAIYVIERMYYINFGDTKGPFPVTSLTKDTTGEMRRSILLDPADIPKLQNADGKSLEVILSGMWKQAKDILKPPYIYYSMLANTLMFTCLFGYYGLALWFPEFFDRLEEHAKVSDTPATICELIHLKSLSAENQSITMDAMWIDGECPNNSSDISVYINTFIIGVTTVTGNVIFTFIEGKCGCKLLTIVTMFVSGCSALAVYFVNTTLYTLVTSCIFLTFVEAATMVIQSAASDLFPTKIRGLAMCIAWLSGRTGSCTSNILVGRYIDTMCEIPIMLIAGLLFFGTALGFALPAKSNSRKGNDV